ncbi:MAG: hypothetical protein G3M70_02240 [Candidatus Nitronauta litoralis]|uniref:Uncharacterized protein n=1 Tax=Candidatus Nitronauta litoralis TaxID=2705533 RepID=A0A7T0FYQ5_9BACT|nr:MAG: hypothetical protein G3M70_02240 [Candidatus Nitronauta litoralis]
MFIRFRVATTVFILSFSLLFSACTSGVTRATSLGNPHLNAARQLKDAAVSSFPQCSNNGALIDYDNTEGITYVKNSCVLRNGKVFRVRKTFVTNGNPNWAPYVEDNEGRIAVLWEWIGEVSTPPVTAVDITITAPSDQGVIERSDQDIVFSYGDGLGVVQSWIAISVNGNVVPVSCNVGSASASCLPADPLPAGEYTIIVTVTAPSGASDTEQVAYRILDLPPDPGEAGKATLLGIDSDNDGVRDDIQRYIELTYPESAKTRAALRQYAKAANDALENAEDKRTSINNAYKANRSQECLYFIFREKEGSADSAYKIRRTRNRNVPGGGGPP